MTDDWTKERIGLYLATAYDRYAQRYYEDLVREMHENPEKTGEIHHSEYYNALLETKRAFVAGFQLYVLDQVRNDDAMMRRRKTLVRAVIASIISKEGVKIDDLVEEPDSSFSPSPKDKDPNLYVRRSIQDIIRNRYKGVFFQSVNSGDDARFHYYKSIFSPENLPTLPETQEVKGYLQKMSAGKPVSGRTAFLQLLHCVRCTFTSPIYLQDLIEFRNECVDAFVKLRINNEIAKLLRTELEAFSESLSSFYWALSSILAMEWLRSRGQTKKRKLIDEGYPFTHSREKADRAAKLLIELTGSRQRTAELLQQSAIDFSMRFGMYREAIFAYEQVVNLQTEHLHLGATFQEIAICYREIKEYPSMLKNIKQALVHFEQSRDPDITTICLKNLAEAEWMTGNKDAALAAYSKAERNSAKMSTRRRLVVLLNLALSCSRTGDTTMELRYLKAWMKLNLSYSIDEDTELNEEAKKIEKDVELKNALYVTLRIEELLRGW